jgi:hypothetical protein
MHVQMTTLYDRVVASRMHRPRRRIPKSAPAAHSTRPLISSHIFPLPRNMSNPPYYPAPIHNVFSNIRHLPTNIYCGIITL